jgi:hypothetical protein
LKVELGLFRRSQSRPCCSITAPVLASTIRVQAGDAIDGAAKHPVAPARTAIPQHLMVVPDMTAFL